MTGQDNKDLRAEIAKFTKVIRLNPKDAEAYYNRGNAKYKLGDKEEAIGDWTKAIELNPRHAKAYFNRGIAKHSLGEHYEGACPDWKRAGELGHREVYDLFKKFCKQRTGKVLNHKEADTLGESLSP